MKIFPALLFLLLATTLSLGNARAQSLADAVRLMAENEPELLAAERDTRATYEDYKVAKSDLLPYIGANGSLGVSNRDRDVDGLTSSGDTLFSRSLGISLRQLLYDGGVSGKSAESSKHAIASQEFLERAMLEERVVDLAEVYMEVLRTHEQLKASEENVRQHRKIERMLKEIAENGGTRADLALVQGRLNLAINSLDQQKLVLRQATSRFARLTSTPPKGLTQPKVPTLPDAMKSVDLSGNWDFLAATEAVEVSRLRWESVKRYRHPKVYFDTGYSVGEDVNGIEGSDNEATASIVGSWDLFTGGRNTALDRREEFQLEKTEYLLAAADRDRNYRLDLLWQERSAAYNSMDLLRQYTEKLTRVTSDYEEQFQVGRKELLNILDVHNELHRARSQYIDARYETRTSHFRILGLQGRFVDYLLGPEEAKILLPRGAERNQSVDMIEGLHGRIAIHDLKHIEDRELSETAPIRRRRDVDGDYEASTRRDRSGKRLHERLFGN